MGFKDWGIGTQLTVGLGTVLACVLLLGGLAHLQTGSLWQETQGLYEHPLTVRRALSELTVDIFAMHRSFGHAVATDNPAERESLLASIDIQEIDASRQIGILYAQYLGPRADVDRINEDLVQWKAIRNEILRLLQAGQTVQAQNRNKPTGIAQVQVDSLMGHIGTVSDYATARGDQFYLDAANTRNALSVQLAIGLALALLLSLGSSYLLLTGIREPVKKLTAATEQYRQGRLDARSGYVSANEFGTLAASFDNLAETVQRDLQSKANAAKIAEVMLREQDLGPFCHALLQALLEQTGSQVGAVYLLNAPKTAFEYFASIGLGAGRRASFSAVEYEGEFGSVLTTRQPQRLADIPVDTPFNLTTVTGELRPREILTIPILAGSEVIAVISLASIQGYSATAVRLVDDTWSMLTARLNGVLAFQQIRAVSEQLECQNRELEAQKRELAVQADELSEQNVELDLQTKQLDQANRLKSTFLSNMSHELRTPLNSVIALAGVLSRRLRGAIPEEEYSYLEIVERNGKNLLALINDILDLSRIEAGREEINPSHFTVGDLVAEVVSVIEPQAREKNIALVNRVPDTLPPLRSDYVKCRHILQNIVANAVKFTEEGHVEISAEQNGEAMQITVVDSGIGIAPDQLPRIFEEFRQADESTSRKFGGTGLGLAIAKKYATLLRGTIAVTSTPGGGSTFTLSLPLVIGSFPMGQTTTESEPSARAGAVELSAPRPDGPAFPGRPGKYVLLVDDSEPAVIQITDMLAGQGYHVLVARNGKQALELVGHTVPDAMILDLMMPEVDGFQVLQAIRNTEQTAQIPVLILTAKHITPEELRTLKGNHVQQLIRKGDVNKTELLAAVEKMVSPAPARRKPPKEQPARKPVILVVEDNSDNLKTVRALLGDTCTVIQAGDGGTGIEQATAHKPDLILLDISLPVMDGIQVLETIRNEESLRHIPVIALTARAMKGEREEILGYGFDGYVSKPIDARVLEATVKEILDG